MTYLEFNERDSRHIGIFTADDRCYLGALELIRVGAWESWCLTDVPDPSIYFSASCQDEIREKTKQLNAKKRKQRDD